MQNVQFKTHANGEITFTLTHDGEEVCEAAAALFLQLTGYAIEEYADCGGGLAYAVVCKDGSYYIVRTEHDAWEAWCCTTWRGKANFTAENSVAHGLLMLLQSMRNLAQQVYLCDEEGRDSTGLELAHNAILQAVRSTY